ncbi:MAG: hypothetical protein ACKVP3_23625 [Hyphomicrobiaceae bacterium]
MHRHGYIAPFYAFNRPANTTQYAQNELVANSATAADVVPLSWNVDPIGGRGKIVAVRLFTDNEAVTAAIFNLHIFREDPGVPTNGDNGAYSVASVRQLLATVALDLSSGATVSSTDKMERIALSTPIVFQVPPENRVLYGLLSTGTSGTYTPISGEIFEVTLEIEA